MWFQDSNGSIIEPIDVLHVFSMAWWKRSHHGRGDKAIIPVPLPYQRSVFEPRWLHSLFQRPSRPGLACVKAVSGMLMVLRMCLFTDNPWLFLNKSSSIYNCSVSIHSYFVSIHGYSVSVHSYSMSVHNYSVSIHK